MRTSATIGDTAPAGPGAGSLKGAQARVVAVVFGILGLIAVFTPIVDAVARGTGPGITRLRLFGTDVGWYGIDESLALVSGPVLSLVLRTLNGGPGAASREDGNDALTLVAAMAAEDAV